MIKGAVFAAPIFGAVTTIWVLRRTEIWQIEDEDGKNRIRWSG